MQTKASSKQVYLAFIACLFMLLVRLVYCYKLGYLGLTRYPDEVNYYLNTAKLISQEGLQYFLNPRSLWNAPLNSIIVWLFQENILFLQLFNLFLISLSSFFIWSAVRHLSNVKLAWQAMLFTFLYVPFTEYGCSILSEAISLFCITYSFWLYSNKKHFYTAGLIFGLATLTRPATFLFPLFFLLIVFVFNRLQFKEALKFALAFALLILPYAFKNYYYFGEFKIANGSGAVLYLGNDLRTFGNEPVYSGMQFDTLKHTKPYTHLDSKGDEILTKIAIARAVRQPVETALLNVEKLGRLLFGSSHALFYPYYSWHTDQRQMFTKLVKIVLPLMLATYLMLLVMFSFKKNQHLVFGYSLIGYFVLLHSLLFAIPRMVMPVYGIIIIVACASIKSSRVMLASIILSMLISSWIAFQFDLINPYKVSSLYANAFDKQIKLQLEKVATKKKSTYLLKLPNTLQLETNQVLMLEAECDKASKLKVFWLNSKEETISLDSGTNWYRFSVSNRSSWQGEVSEFKAQTKCEIIKALLLH